MKKYLVPILLLITGCATPFAESIQKVSSNYETVMFDDGINIEEAKIIAQNELVRENLVKFYDLPNPRIVEDVSDLPDHEKYWFISFKEIKIANIRFIFMVVINRQTGKVKFANDYQEGNRWILEAVLLGG